MEPLSLRTEVGPHSSLMEGWLRPHRASFLLSSAGWASGAKRHRDAAGPQTSTLTTSSQALLLTRSRVKSATPRSGKKFVCSLATFSPRLPPPTLSPHATELQPSGPRGPSSSIILKGRRGRIQISFRVGAGVYQW